MTTTKIESLERNTSTSIEVNSMDEALEWVTQLQDEIRHKMEASLCYEDVIAEHKDTIKEFIKMWTPPVQYTIDVTLNNSGSTTSPDKGHQDEMIERLDKIEQELHDLREEHHKYFNKIIDEIKRVVSNWSFWITTYLVYTIAEKEEDRLKAANAAKSQNNKKYEDLGHHAKDYDTQQSNVLSFPNETSAAVPCLEPHFTLVIKDTGEQIDSNLRTWGATFIQLVKYQNLMSGVSIAFIRKYLYDTIDESEASHTQDRIKNLLTKYFEVKLVDYAGEYQSADLFDFEYNPELKELITTKKALIYKGKLLYKGMVVFPNKTPQL
uniref:hypothetical protein n=1 Tax=Alloprevotella sp. TaxID=1872471 RepID=UPI003FEEA2CC